jgi:hypothetical protein
MPYRNYHLCRLQDPNIFETLRYKGQDGADVIMGKGKGSSEWKLQAVRLHKDKWTEDVARKYSEDLKAEFEPASGKEDHTDELVFFFDGYRIPIRSWEAEGPALPKCYTEIMPAGKAKQYAQRLQGVEIFATGIWNGDPYTEQDLDTMVSAFHSNVGPRPPALKLGHDDNQKWFGQKDGAPALGWVERLYRKGEKLLADFGNVPDAVISMIKNKNYRTKSAEIYWNLKDREGRLWPRALKDVALQGADIPAVNSLEDLQAFLMSDGSRDIRKYSGEGNGDFKTYSEQEGGNKMEVKKLQEDLEKTSRERDEALKREKDANERAVKAETDAGLKIFSLELDALVREGKVLPAEIDGLKRDFVDMGVSLRKYGEKEQTWGQKKVDELKARTKIVNFGETGAGGDDDRTGNDKASVHELTVKTMKARNLDYLTAQNIVREENPGAWKNYVEGGKS